VVHVDDRSPDFGIGEISESTSSRHGAVTVDGGTDQQIEPARTLDTR
jgi:hypothetical protein